MDITTLVEDIALSPNRTRTHEDVAVAADDIADAAFAVIFALADAVAVAAGPAAPSASLSPADVRLADAAGAATPSLMIWPAAVTDAVGVAAAEDSLTITPAAVAVEVHGISALPPAVTIGVTFESVAEAVMDALDR